MSSGYVSIVYRLYPEFSEFLLYKYLKLSDGTAEA